MSFEGLLIMDTLCNSIDSDKNTIFTSMYCVVPIYDFYTLVKWMY